MSGKVSLRDFNNDWFKPGRSSLIILIWYFINILFFKNRFFPFSSIKVFILKFFGAKIGERVLLKPGINIKYPWKLEIGSDVWIGEGVWIDNLDQVLIKDNVCISQGAMLLCGNHNYKLSTFDLIIGPITLESGAWVGAQTVVCPSVVVGAHAVLTVGSIATKNMDSNGIYQGNPAVKVKTRIIREN